MKTTRFISIHAKCGDVSEVDGYMVMCGRSYGHDDPETRKTPTDHYEPGSEVTWPSEKLKKVKD